MLRFVIALEVPVVIDDLIYDTIGPFDTVDLALQYGNARWPTKEWFVDSLYVPQQENE